ncbi:MAG: DUF6520 family protein [Bacteroidota bacterium]
MKKLKFPLAFIAVLFAVGAAFAFNVPTPKEKSVVTRYHYTSSSSLLVDMQNINNWIAEDPDCGSEGSKPCAIDFNGNLSQFDAQLDNYTTAAQVTAAAVERKN